MKNMTVKSIVAGVLLGAAAHAQPTVSVPLTNVACPAGPKTDMLPETPGANGFFSIFDGTSFTGWWESCKTGHSAPDRTNGGIWVIDPAEKAMVAMQSNTYAGSIMMTNKKYDHYEMIFDFWSTYGNDAGVFNRTTESGSCWQTTLDYIGGSSVGGGFGEGYNAPNLDFYTFGANGSTINNVGKWTTLTASRNPASFGCPAGGCAVGDWTKVWDANGWNQIRVKFFGGLAAGSRLHMQAWVRRVAGAPGAAPDNWVPTFDDSLTNVTPANHIGLQIHQGNGRWKLPAAGGKGAWFKNIMLRPLDANGVPLTVALRDGKPGYSRHRVEARAGRLLGSIDGDHEITVRDLSGRVLSTHRGASGGIAYSLPSSARGMLVVDVRTGSRVERIRALGI